MKELALGPVLSKGSIFERQIFNLTFDGQKERFSYLVPDDSIAFFHWLAETPPKLRHWAIFWAGRSYMEDHCTDFAFRVTAENKIEVRLEFNPVWYLNGTTNGSPETPISPSTEQGIG